MNLMGRWSLFRGGLGFYFKLIELQAVLWNPDRRGNG